MQVEISNAITRAYIRFAGRGADAVRTVIASDLVVVILTGVQTHLERELVANGAAGQVLRARMALNAIMRETMVSDVEHATGCQVLDVLGSVNTSPDVSGIVFTLQRNAGLAVPTSSV